MDRGVGAAARLLPESDRKDLAIQALAGSEAVSALAARHGVSRKFVYQQTHKARAALDDAFSSAMPDEEVFCRIHATRCALALIEPLGRMPKVSRAIDVLAFDGRAKMLR